MNFILTYFFIFILNIFKLIPSKILMHIAYALGNLLYWIPLKIRRKTVIIDNINLCFTNYTEQQKKILVKNTIQEICRSILERGLVWFGSKSKVKNAVNIYGIENIPKDGAILLGIHMSGLELTSIALSSSIYTEKWASIYMPQRNALFDKIVKQQRSRFGTLMLSRSQNAKEIVRHLKNNGYLQIFMDMDFGIKDSIFSKFYGNNAATITSVPRLSKLSNKKVIPMLPIFNRQTAKYDLYIMPPFDNYPSDNLQNDIDRLNKHFEESINIDPTQYWWVHRRFKTKYTNHT